MTRPSARWDAGQYARFEKERAQPFHDLLARASEGVEASLIADLGCGDGTLTRTLFARWPRARIWGVDSSPEMLARASSTPHTEGLGILERPESDSQNQVLGWAGGQLDFVLADMIAWSPPQALDLIVSNAALHWVPDHESALRTLAGRLAPGGTMAVQIPNNGEEHAYRTLEALLREPPWPQRLGGAVQRPIAETPSFYESRLRALGFSVEVWETIYQHRLSAPSEIVEWVKGTSLRPVLSALTSQDAGAFLEELTARVLPAYPPDEGGVLFPFRRLFFVARKA